MEKDGGAEMERQGVALDRTHAVRKAHLRYEGTDTALVVDYGSKDDIVANFEVAHRQQFGFISPEKSHIVEALSVELVGAGEVLEDPIVGDETESPAPEPLATVDMYSADATHATPIYDREQMHPGCTIDGPAILKEANATTVVEPGWRAEVTKHDHLVLTRVVALPKQVAIGTQADPVMLEVFNNLFMSIAEQMGGVLQNTSYSVNIKERLDFSCAIFDTAGDLVANAPHIPVHLGSMSESVKTVAREREGEMKRGDVYMLNTPYNGGPIRSISMRKACCSTTSSWFGRERSLSTRRRRCLPAASTRRAISITISATSRRRSPPTRKACRSSTGWWSISASTS